MKKENIKKVYAGKSRMLAVKLYCHECHGYDGHKIKGRPTVSYISAGHLVVKCAVKSCPLHSYRL